jgi:hypothetical protein
MPVLFVGVVHIFQPLLQLAVPPDLVGRNAVPLSFQHPCKIFIYI